MNSEQTHEIVKRFINFLETGKVAEGLFTSDIFCDLTVPKWRVQAQGFEDVVELRLKNHPGAGTVPRWRYDPTPTGFILEAEERWTQNGKDWYCREMFRADLRGDSICSLSIYCTGDWDTELEAQHAKAVTLLQP